MNRSDRPATALSQFAFTIMSFRESMNAVYEEGIESAVTSLGIQCRRVDRTHFNDRITKTLLEDLRNALFVVADLSDPRPNVYYELGLAHAIDKQVIMIVDDSGKIPFDVQDFNFIVYRGIDDLRSRLSERIRESVLKNPDPPSDNDVRCGKFGGYAIANGRLLMGTINGWQASDQHHRIDLEVVALRGSPPLEGKARFYFHDTHDPASEAVTIKNNRAVTYCWSSEYHTVGAKVDGDKTLLELNLKVLPGAKARFYRWGRGP